MSSTQELPEHQYFHILKRGTEEPLGPYSQNQLVELLNDSSINASDLVYYEALEGWTPLSQVFDFHQKICNFSDEGQDPQVVDDTFNFITNRVEPGEEMYYIAVQYQAALSLTAAVLLSSPKSIVLTNHRVCIVKQKVIGEIEMDEYPLEQIKEGIKRIKPNDKVGLFNLVLKSGEWVETNKIPADQLDMLEQHLGALLAGTHEVQ